MSSGASDSGARAPAISVIVPTHDRPARLAECLRALSRQDLPRRRWEVVVVDDGTPDARSVAAAVEPVQGRCDVRLVSQARSGPAAARNRGAAVAKFDYLAFTDDDCRPDSRWLSALAAAFERTPQAVLGGCTRNGVSANVFSEASQQLIDYVIRYFVDRGQPFFPSNNIALSRAAFERIGGFDATFPRAAGEDRDFCAKCRAHGFRLDSAANAVVEHQHALTLRGFLRQHFNYGRGAYLFHRLEALRGGHSLRIEPLRFYVELVRAPFNVAGPARGRIRIAALLLLSQAANASGFLAERLGM